MLKPQDCIILIKLLANPETKWSQRQLAEQLCISLSEINAGIKRLGEAGLLRKDKTGKLFPNIHAAEEFLVSSIKFFFPGKLGEYTRGVPTGVASPIFQGKMALGQDPLPVWPDPVGEKKGVALLPLHPAVPQALREHPDPFFYEILTLVDVIRMGRSRERNMAVDFLKQKLHHEK